MLISVFNGLHFPLLLYYFNLYLILIVISQIKLLLLLSSEVIIVVYDIQYLIYTLLIYCSVHIIYNFSNMEEGRV